MIRFRPFSEQDWDAVWRIMEPVFRAGETYPYSPDITKQEARQAWVEVPQRTYVATDENDRVLGTYYIKPNQSSLGAHVCNCGYIVGEAARGKGVATGMCEHSQREAIALGYRAMQYNLVVSTNEAAVHLWKKQGFDLVGTLPGAFRHQRLGFVDAHIMYKQLQTDS